MPPTVKLKQSKEPTQPPFQGIALSWQTGFHPKNTKDPVSNKTGNQLDNTRYPQEGFSDYTLKAWIRQENTAENHD